MVDHFNYTLMGQLSWQELHRPHLLYYKCLQTGMAKFCYRKLLLAMDICSGSMLGHIVFIEILTGEDIKVNSEVQEIGIARVTNIGVGKCPVLTTGVRGLRPKCCSFCIVET